MQERYGCGAARVLEVVVAQLHEHGCLYVVHDLYELHDLYVLHDLYCRVIVGIRCVICICRMINVRAVCAA